MLLTGQNRSEPVDSFWISALLLTCTCYESRSMVVRTLLCLAVSLTLATSAPAAEKSPAQSDDFLAGFRKFADRHCLGCHGPDVQKRKLRLDTLPAKFADKDTATTWVKVLDRLSHNDMPPKNKPRPAEKDVKSVVTGLRNRLHQASLDKQKLEGRVVLRRLNRTEYETTLRDLLATPVRVKDLLPDDNSSAGFDNVSSVLDISATHLLRYQEAAEKAIRSVIPNRPQPSFKERRTGKQVTEKMRLFAPFLGKSAKLDGDTLVLHTRTYGHVPCATAPAPIAGRYRVKISASALGTGGKPLPMLCSCRDLYGRDDNDIRAVIDVPADKPTVLGGEFLLKPREVIVFNGWSLMSENEFQRKGKKVKPGAALAVHWIEIEGPLGDWPPAGYRSLFDGVPLKPASVARAEAEGRPVPPQPAKRPDGWWIYDPLVLTPKKPRQDAERLMRSFLPRAFRRPVSKDLEKYFVKVVHDGLDKKLSFTQAMLLGYKAALCSPHFLFLVEPVDAGKPRKRTPPGRLRRGGAAVVFPVVVDAG